MTATASQSLILSLLVALSLEYYLFASITLPQANVPSSLKNNEYVELIPSLANAQQFREISVVTFTSNGTDCIRFLQPHINKQERATVLSSHQ